MDRNRVTLMFVGILVCVPVLALYQFGFFPETARWLQARLPHFLVLPEEGVKGCMILQYSYYTTCAFVSAWAGLALRRPWQKFAFLLGLSYLTVNLTVTLAWNGLLFEPFSGLLATWAAGLLAMISAGADRQHQDAPTVVPAG